MHKGGGSLSHRKHRSGTFTKSHKFSAQRSPHTLLMEDLDRKAEARGMAEIRRQRREAQGFEPAEVWLAKRGRRKWK